MPMPWPVTLEVAVTPALSVGFNELVPGPCTSRRTHRSFSLIHWGEELWPQTIQGPLRGCPWPIGFLIVDWLFREVDSALVAAIATSKLAIGPWPHHGWSRRPWHPNLVGGRQPPGCLDRPAPQEAATAELRDDPLVADPARRCYAAKRGCTSVAKVGHAAAGGTGLVDGGEFVDLGRHRQIRAGRSVAFGFTARRTGYRQGAVRQDLPGLGFP